MADSVLFLGWNRSIPGREQQAMQLFQKTVEFYKGLQSDNRIASFEAVILGAHGGDLNGFFLLRGDAEKLGRLRGDDVFLDFVIEATYCLQGFGVVPGYTGEAIQDRLSRWSKLISS